MFCCVWHLTGVAIGVGAIIGVLIALVIVAVIGCRRCVLITQSIYYDPFNSRYVQLPHCYMKFASNCFVTCCKIVTHIRAHNVAMRRLFELRFYCTQNFSTMQLLQTR